MNFINRTIVVLQLLALIVLGPLFIVFVVLNRANLVGMLTALGNSFVSGQNALQIQAICMALAGITSLIALLFLVLEFQRPAIKRLKVQQVMGGEAEITADAITHRLEQAIMEIPDVLKTRPHITAMKKGNVVDLGIEVETSADVNVPQKTQEVLTIARSVAEEKIGLKVGKIQVRIDHSKKSKGKKEKSDAGRETQQQLPPPQQPQNPG